MINSKITKTTNSQSTEEKFLKLLESMDWKLWEMYNMMKDYTTPKTEEKQPKPAPKLKKTEDQKTA